MNLHMFAVCIITLLCLTSVSHSAPLACEDLVQPLDQLDPHQLEGRWALAAGSLKINGADKLPPLSNSVRIDFYNSTFTQANRDGPHCRSRSQNISIEGHRFNFMIGQTFNFSGTFFKTSCPDCVMLNLVVDSPNYKSVELYLFSKRREVDQKELDEFVSQVKCLNMPPHFVMDPTQSLCPVTVPAASTKA
uniref:Apolipoprotein M n=1 Tax=Lates calcarifer TaxID=8187 RepID=A0A4W6FSI6_LATCA